MNDNVKSRLKAYIKHLGLNVVQFERKCGFSNGYVANIRVSIQPDKIERILKVFPSLNTNWLLTGEGEMERVVLEEMEENTTNRDDVLLKALDEICEQRKLVSRAQDQIDQLISITKSMAEAIQKLK